MARTKKPPSPALTFHGFKLSAQEAEILKKLALELADRMGRAASRSATLRALLRLSARFDGVMLERLADEMGEDFKRGVRWGKDSQKPPG
jgi:hypothetical protein